MQSPKPKIISSLIVAAVVLFAANEISERFYFAPFEEESAKRREKLEELKRSNDENERLKENAEELGRAVEDAERRYDALKPLLPPEAELPRVFDWIAKRALERNLKLERFSQDAKLIERGPIGEIPLQVEVLGYYDGVGRFLEDFSRFERVLRVRGVRMTQAEQQNSPFATVRADINFSAYVSR